MAQFSRTDLKTKVNNLIIENSNGEITALILNEILRDIADSCFNNVQDSAFDLSAVLGSGNFTNGEDINLSLNDTIVIDGGYSKIGRLELADVDYFGSTYDGELVRGLFVADTVSGIVSANPITPGYSSIQINPGWALFNAWYDNKYVDLNLTTDETNHFFSFSVGEFSGASNTTSVSIDQTESNILNGTNTFSEFKRPEYFVSQVYNETTTHSIALDPFNTMDGSRISAYGTDGESILEFDQYYTRMTNFGLNRYHEIYTSFDDNMIQIRSIDHDDYSQSSIRMTPINIVLSSIDPTTLGQSDISLESGSYYSGCSNYIGTIISKFKADEGGVIISHNNDDESFDSNIMIDSYGSVKTKSTGFSSTVEVPGLNDIGDMMLTYTSFELNLRDDAWNSYSKFSQQQDGFYYYINDNLCFEVQEELVEARYDLLVGRDLIMPTDSRITNQDCDIVIDFQVSDFLPNGQLQIGSYNTNTYSGQGLTISEFGYWSNMETVIEADTYFYGNSLIGLDNISGIKINPIGLNQLFGQWSATSLPSYSDNSAAVSGGLSVNRLYKTPTGEIRIVI